MTTVGNQLFSILSYKGLKKVTVGEVRPTLIHAAGLQSKGNGIQQIKVCLRGPSSFLVETGPEIEGRPKLCPSLPVRRVSLGFPRT